MALFTGARKTNVLEMRWKDIDFDNAVWRIPETKNGDPQNIPLIDYALQILRQIPKTSEWVFPNEKSKSGHFEDPKRAWNRILARAGIENLRIHDIRRTMGAWLVNSGATSDVAGKVLGHKSQEATKIYARLSNETSREWMNIAMKNLIEGQS